MLKVARTTVASSWADRRDSTGFPRPIEVLRMGPVYDLDEVQRWYDEWTSAPTSRKRGSTR